MSSFRIGVSHIYKLDEQKSIRDFCINAHKYRWLKDTNKYYGPFEYKFHLNMAYNIACMFGFGTPLIEQACYGHDLLEDTNVTISDLEKEGFSKEAIDIIKRVTDEPGKNRKERKSKTYPKIAGHRNATLIKLADRIANVLYNKSEEHSNHIEMYKKEHPEFKAMLYNRDMIDLQPMWNALEGLLC